MIFIIVYSDRSQHKKKVDILPPSKIKRKLFFSKVVNQMRDLVFFFHNRINIVINRLVRK